MATQLATGRFGPVFEYCPTCEREVRVLTPYECADCRQHIPEIEDGESVSECCEQRVHPADDLGRHKCSACGDPDVLLKEVGA